MRLRALALVSTFLVAILTFGCAGAGAPAQSNASGASSAQSTAAPAAPAQSTAAPAESAQSAATPAASTQNSDTSKPIKIGWLAALTGPNSAPGVAMDRGMTYAVKKVNDAGGIKGRKIELVTRDTQGDPNKAVDAALQVINNDKVDFIIGPTLSGETLATGSVLTKNGMPNFVLGSVDSLISTSDFPLAFRVVPSNSQWVGAANSYAVKTLGIKKIALIGDTTGYGTDTVAQAEKLLTAAGATVSYKNLIDPNQTDVSADMQKAKDSGAGAIMVWTSATGLDARLINARGDLGWNVPFVGHPTMGSGAVKALLTKPEYWKDVDIVGYRSMSYDDSGKLPAATQKFLDDGASQLLLSDASLWWVAASWDCVQLLKSAVEQAGSTDPRAVSKALETVKDQKLVYGQYSFTDKEHNGYYPDGVVMNTADSFKNGVYKLAPGYGAN